VAAGSGSTGRGCSADGATELPLPTWPAFAATKLLDRLALERMPAKLSTRRYQTGLEPVGSRIAQDPSGTSKSANSRRFIAATERTLAELLAADLSGLDLVPLMVDGIRVAEHCCVVALGLTFAPAPTWHRPHHPDRVAQRGRQASGCPVVAVEHVARPSTRQSRRVVFHLR
jgi:hypothetical protein